MRVETPSYSSCTGVPCRGVLPQITRVSKPKCHAESLSRVGVHMCPMGALRDSRVQRVILHLSEGLLHNEKLVVCVHGSWMSKIRCRPPTHSALVRRPRGLCSIGSVLPYQTVCLLVVQGMSHRCHVATLTDPGLDGATATHMMACQRVLSAWSAVQPSHLRL